MLSDNRNKFYRVESGPCFEILTRWREQRRLAAKAVFDWVESKGGTGFVPGSDDNVINGLPIRVVIFDGPPPTGWREHRIDMATPLKLGQTTATPDMRTKIGKALIEEIKLLPRQPSSYGPCDAIGYPTGLRYEGQGCKGSTSLGFIETMGVGWIADGPFYVRLPDERHARKRLEERGYTVEGEPWEPLPGMVEILREEMELDFARANLAQAGAA